MKIDYDPDAVSFQVFYKGNLLTEYEVSSTGLQGGIDFGTVTLKGSMEVDYAGFSLPSEHLRKLQWHNT